MFREVKKKVFLITDLLFIDDLDFIIKGEITKIINILQ